MKSIRNLLSFKNAIYFPKHRENMANLIRYKNMKSISIERSLIVFLGPRLLGGYYKNLGNQNGVNKK
jgi:hypothetical protein